MSGINSRLLPDSAQDDGLLSRAVHRLTTARQCCPDLRGTDFADIVICGIVGRGRRCVAFAARRGNRDLVLKVYQPQAAIRHAHRCGGSIARYEYERNAAFHRVPTLARFIAAPIGFSSTPRAEMFLQERVFGEHLSAFMRTCSATCRDKLLAEVLTILEGAHRAGLFDLDLHPSNIVVKRDTDGNGRPMLFDFNKVPYHVRPPNALFGLLVKLGLIGRRARDHRHWKRLSRLPSDLSLG